MTGLAARLRHTEALAIGALCAAARTWCVPLPLGHGSNAAWTEPLAVTVAISVVVVRMRLRGASFVVRAIGAALATCALATDALDRFGPLQWVMLSAVLLLAERPSRATYASAIAVVVLWANVSPLAVAGAVVLSIAYLAPRGAARAPTRDAAFATIAAWTALLCTSRRLAGIGDVAFALWGIHDANAIFAWRPSVAAPGAYRVGVMLAAALLAAAPREGGSAAGTDRRTALAGLLLALTDGAFLPVAALATVPCGTAAFARAFAGATEGTGLRTLGVIVGIAGSYAGALQATERDRAAGLTGRAFVDPDRPDPAAVRLVVGSGAYRIFVRNLP